MEIVNSILTVTPIVTPYDFVWSIECNGFCIVVDPTMSLEVFEYIQTNALNFLGIIITQNKFVFESCVNEYIQHFSDIYVWGSDESNLSSINQRVSGGQIFQLPHINKYCKILKVYDDALDKVAFLIDYVHLFADDSIFPQGYVRVNT